MRNARRDKMTYNINISSVPRSLCSHSQIWVRIQKKWNPRIRKRIDKLKHFQIHCFGAYTLKKPTILSYGAAAKTKQIQSKNTDKVIPTNRWKRKDPRKRTISWIIIHWTLVLAMAAHVWRSLLILWKYDKYIWEDQSLDQSDDYWRTYPLMRHSRKLPLMIMTMINFEGVGWLVSEK